MCFFFFKQKTAYEMRISDWSSDVCSSDLSGEASNALYCSCLGTPDIGDDATCAVAGRFGRADAGARALHGRNRRSGRSEQRRVGNECVSTCRSGGAPYHHQKTEHEIPPRGRRKYGRNNGDREKIAE